jgi:hypothetical protein
MRRGLSRFLFFLGFALVLAAVALIAWARLLPAQGLEDLGWFVFALLLLAVSGVPFALGLLVAPSAPRGLLVAAVLGALVSAVGGVAFLTTGTRPLQALGVVVLLLVVAGLVRAVRLWRAPQA